MSGRYSKLKFKRIHSGYYQAKTKAIVVGPRGEEELLDVTVEIQHMPEWTGPDKWAVTAEAKKLDYTIKLVALSDIIAPTKADAVIDAQIAVERGWKYVSGLGYAAR